VATLPKPTTVARRPGRRQLHISGDLYPDGTGKPDRTGDDNDNAAD